MGLPMLMPMRMLGHTIEVMAMAATGAMVATEEAMVATTVERGRLMLLLMLMLRPTTGVMAMATGATEAMVATGVDTGAKGLHYFQNSVRVLHIRPNDFK